MLHDFKWTPEHVDCTICAGQTFTPIFHQDVHGLGLRLVACNTCGLIFFNPRPTLADYERFYDQHYHRMYPSRLVFNQTELGSKIATSSARMRFGWYEKWLKHSSRLFEIGPGEGSFLAEVRANLPDCSISGIDASPQEVNVCKQRGLNVSQGFLEGVPTSPQFSAIVAFHVLEHVLWPLDFLSEAHKRLESGGVLILEVPNIVGDWHGLGMLHVAHPHHFSPATLSFAVQKSGFEILELTSEEDPLFQSSIRLVARKSPIPPAVSAPEVNIPQLREAVTTRLNGWRADRMRFVVQQTIFQLLGPEIGARLWQRVNGARWRKAISISQKQQEVPCA